jgi:hypothetical protein
LAITSDREFEKLSIHVNGIVFAQPGGVAFAILIVAMGILGVALRPDKFALGWGPACGLLAVYFSTRFTYAADRLKHELIIERRNLLWSHRKIYDAHLIDRIAVWDTAKGAGLVIHFRTGRKKSLTRSLSSDRDATESAAVALNYFLHTGKHDCAAQ